MSFELEIDDRVLQKLIADSDSNAKRILTQLSDGVIADWKRAMRDSERGANGRSVRGSAPAVDTGELSDSFESRVSSTEARIYGNSYAIVLDGNMRRPFIEDGLPDDDEVARITRAVLGG